jgi:hypothetical protein
LKIIARKIVNKFLKSNKGHSSLINSLLKRMYSSIISSESMVYYSAENIIANHIAEALTHFVNDRGLFEEQRYFEEVFLKNVDVWGFIVAYIEIIESAENLFQSNTMPNKLLHTFYKYWVSPRFSAEAIPISELLEELESLNTIYESNSATIESGDTLKNKSKPLLMLSDSTKPKGTTITTTRKSSSKSSRRTRKSSTLSSTRKSSTRKSSTRKSSRKSSGKSSGKSNTRKSSGKSNTRKSSGWSKLRKQILKLPTATNMSIKAQSNQNKKRSTTIIKRESKYRLPKNHRCHVGSKRCSRKREEKFCCYKK